MNQEVEQEQRVCLISKLNNVLRGDAMMTKDDKSIAPDERRARMKAIEDLKYYIDNYEENIKLISQAKEYNLRMEDDCR